MEIAEDPPSPSGRGPGEGFKIRIDLRPSTGTSIEASPLLQAVRCRACASRTAGDPAKQRRWFDRPDGPNRRRIPASGNLPPRPDHPCASSARYRVFDRRTPRISHIVRLHRKKPCVDHAGNVSGRYFGWKDSGTDAVCPRISNQKISFSAN